MKPSKTSLLIRIKNVSILVLIAFSLMLHLFINARTDNYDTTRSMVFGNYHATDQNVHSYPKISRSSRSADQKVSLRVNKRFQSSSFVVPSNKFLTEDMGESYTDQHKIGQPTTYLLFSVIIAQSLRGPPFAA